MKTETALIIGGRSYGQSYDLKPDEKQVVIVDAFNIAETYERAVKHDGKIFLVYRPNR